ncbi:hypothetical protein BHE74_00030776, partial [Ensete ventricosum]
MSWSRCQAQFDLSEQDRPHRVVSIGLVDPLLLLRTCSCTKAEALGRSEDDTVGNSSGVRRKLAEGVGSLPGWRKGVTESRARLIGRLSGVAKRLIGDWE